MPPKRPVGLREVAELAGVSVITASRVMRGQTIVREATRDAVLRAAEHLGYVPNTVAGSLKSQKSNLIAVVLPTISGSIFAETIEGIHESIRPAGYQLIIGESSYDTAEEEAAVRALVQRRPDGIIITGTNHTGQTRQILRASGIPVVEIWDLADEPIDSVVGFSNTEAAADFTHQLVRRGYRRFGLATGPIVSGNRALKRVEGFRRALREAGLEEVASIIVPYEYLLGNILEGGRRLMRFLADSPPIDCLFCTNELSAIGAVVVGRREGRRIPGDVAVVGFGDVETATLIDPPLTTVRIKGREMGKAAGDHIIGVLARGDDRPADGQQNRVVDIGYEIIWRDSG